MQYNIHPLSFPLTSQYSYKSIFIAGIPGSGKSTLTAGLAKKLNAIALCEPEEKEWPDCVKRRDLSGCFSAAMWFRSIRTHYYSKAIELASKGFVVLVDSYFDKLFLYCLGKPHMDWLIPETDPYFSIAKAISEVDYRCIPLPDAIVFFDIDYDDWIQIASSRKRLMEKGWFNKDFYMIQTYFKIALECLEKTQEANVIRFKPHYGNIESSLEELSHVLGFMKR